MFSSIITAISFTISPAQDSQGGAAQIHNDDDNDNNNSNDANANTNTT